MHRPPRTLAEVEAVENAAPFRERLAAGNVHAAIARSAAAHPDRPAIIYLRHGTRADTPRTTSYAGLLDRITASANLLRRLGVGEGDVTTLLMPIVPETHFLLWAAETAGIANPVNPFLEVEHIVGICRAAGTKVLVACHPSISPDPWPRALAVRAAMPEITLVMVGGGEADQASDGAILYEDAIRDIPGDRLEFSRDYDDDTVAAYFHTGGTTGVPKLARHTHLGQLLHSWAFGSTIPGTEPHHYPVGLPLFHVGGATCYGLMPFVMGRTITMVGPAGLRNPDAIRDFYANCARLGWTLIGAVPAVWSMLLQMPHEAHDLSRVTHGAAGGSTLSVEVANAAWKKLGLKVIEGWGMTETHGFATKNPFDGDVRTGSVGLRLPYMNIRVVEADGAGGIRRDCATGEIGLVVVKGPQVFAGYLDPAHDSKAWLADGWLDTGDLGRFDADGYLWLTGRAKDLIIRGGHNIDPAMIEDVLYRHPAVELAAAVGQPDRRVGEMPVAFVQFVKGQSVSEAELKTFVAEGIAERAANPAEITALAEMPLTGVGKIFKPELRHLAARRVFEREAAAVATGSGVQIAVQVGADKVHGTLAVLTIAGEGDREAAAARLREILGPYPLRFEIRGV